MTGNSNLFLYPLVFKSIIIECAVLLLATWAIIPHLQTQKASSLSTSYSGSLAFQV